LSTWLLASQGLAAEPKEGLLAGAAKVDVTPSKPVQMAGYASRKELSTGVHDPLSARVLAFQAGKDRLILVSADIIGYYDGTAAVIREAIIKKHGLKPSELILSAIHTHAGPRITLNEARNHPNNVAYTRRLQEKLLQAVGQALEDLQPVRIGAGTGYSSVGRNRRQLTHDRFGNPRVRLGRNPYGTHDKEVQVLKIEKTSGQLLAAAFDYATHSTALGPKNLTISGDVHGIAEQFVEMYLGEKEKVMAPAFAGASGDIDPCYRVLPGFETKNGWIPEPVLLGTLLGEEVVHTLRGIGELRREGPVRSLFETLQLPGKPRGDGKASGETPKAELNVSVARVGEVAFVGLGAEVLTDVGLAIKKASPFEDTWIITHCNGTAGYLPPQDVYVEGGYEVESSSFASTAAAEVVHRVVKMLHAIH
jgi:hypothetical protein